jgi:hypothetical protein
MDGPPFSSNWARSRYVGALPAIRYVHVVVYLFAKYKENKTYRFDEKPTEHPKCFTVRKPHVLLPYGSDASPLAVKHNRRQQSLT